MKRCSPANEYRKQLETVLTRSNDAIAQVQEGILVEANRSWLDLIGAVDADAVVGQPVMDFFEEANHAALKGALFACLQGRWQRSFAARRCADRRRQRALAGAGADAGRARW